MIALAIDRVAPVGVVRPGLVGKELEMRPVRVGRLLVGALVTGLSSVNFLQEYHVGTGFRDPRTHRFQHEATVAATVALVDVVGEDPDLRAHTAGRPVPW